VQERSGRLEDDIVLTDEQMRNGLIDPARRWPNKIVPFLIDPEFSEYCSTKLQSGKRGVEEIFIHYYTTIPTGRPGGWVTGVMAIFPTPCP